MSECARMLAEYAVQQQSMDNVRMERELNDRLQ